ncbi:MAG TPA: hypothetical protein VGF16_16810, partial [Bryobacteraceae bacterium]
DQQERQSLAPLEMENLQLHARSDILKREMEGLNARLAVNEEQQRKFIRDAVAGRGISRFDNAQFSEGGNIMVTLPDEPAAVPAVIIPPARPNGAASEMTE